MPRILSLLPQGGRLVEPFAGSAAVYLNASPYAKALLCDANRDVIHFYNILLEHKEDFITYCSTLFTPATNLRQFYLELRQRFNGLPPGPERAAVFLYLNRHGYNGLVRYNRSGLFNVPFGRYKQPLFPQEQMRAFIDKHQAMPVTLRGQDFRQTFAQLRAGDVVYADPPYAPLSAAANFTSYWTAPFTAADQEELARLAILAAQQGIPVLISNHDTDFTRKLYQGAQISSFPVRRAISCQARNTANELLALFGAFHP